jgi:hypothetical protein
LQSHALVTLFGTDYGPSRGRATCWRGRASSPVAASMRSTDRSSIQAAPTPPSSGASVLPAAIGR